jgi:hypothetical protein
MAITYTTLGSTVTIDSAGFIPASNVNSAVALVGGYDSAEAGAGVNAGEVTRVSSSTEASNHFGAGSELARQSSAAFLNGASEVYGIPVPETDTSETFGSTSVTSSGTLSNGGVLDPRLHQEHDITATDQSDGSDLVVNAVYGTPSTPSEADTININPRTGDWEADASGEYEITYTYADYADAINVAVNQTVRAVAVCDERTSTKLTLRTELDEAESNIRFLRGVIGAEPNIQSGDISTYTPPNRSWRVVESAPAHGTDEMGTVRTAGAIAGLIAGQPIDVSGSITYDTVDYFTGLNVAYTPSEASDFEAVTAITDEFEVAEGVTTSEDEAFRDIYKVEIVDLVVENIYGLVKDYKGGSNSSTARDLFESRVRRRLASYSEPNAQPPLLASGDGSRPYYVDAALGASDTETDLNMAIDVAPIAKSVNLDFTLGPVQFNGATTQ